MDSEGVRVPGSPVRCPFCKGGLEDLKEIVACAACGARHHAGCHRENGRCATCGATDLLVPTRRPTREPPAGSAIKVEVRDGVLVYSWPHRDDTLACLGVLCILGVVTIPLGIWLLRLQDKRLRNAQGQPRIEVHLGPRSLELYNPSFSTPSVQVEREKLGVARCTEVQGGAAVLALDVGLERKHLSMGGLKAPELEWLVQQIEAWRSG
ncbi:MAG TPA: RING finger protein [Planctomycetota bacterium]|nr:RING finger protein [Planctomycetota bacterium]